MKGRRSDRCGGKEGKEGEEGVEKSERDGNEPDSSAVLRSLAEMKSDLFESCRKGFAERHSFLEERGWWGGRGGRKKGDRARLRFVSFPPSSTS